MIFDASGPSGLADGGALDLRQWIRAGAHWGHKSMARHPRMAPWIHQSRPMGDRVDVLSLDGLAGQVDRARAAIQSALARGEAIIVVGDKPCRRAAARSMASALGAGFVLGRWPAGFLTNAPVHGRALLAAKEAMARGRGVPRRIVDKALRVSPPAGTREAPGLLIWLGGSRQGPLEAKAMGWRVVGVCDSNADPAWVDDPIVCNDDSVGALALLAHALCGQRGSLG